MSYKYKIRYYVVKVTDLTSTRRILSPSINQNQTYLTFNFSPKFIKVSRERNQKFSVQSHSVLHSYRLRCLFLNIEFVFNACLFNVSLYLAIYRG